jgi:hypothetical protein
MKHEYGKDSKYLARLIWVTGIKKPKDDLRNHIQYMKAEGGKLVSVDGAELREIKIDLPDGYYSILKRTKSRVTILMEKQLSEGNFPDYEDLFAVNGRVQVEIDPTSKDKGFSEVIRAMEKNTFDPIRYMGFMDGLSGTVAVESSGDFPVVFLTDTRRAALMPCRSV